MQKIHVRNIFKIFVPLAFPADYTLAPLKAPFGFALTDKRTLNYYQYHMQMFYMSNEKSVEEEAANCFAWGKRNPLYVKYKPNTDQIEGVILQVKVNHYVFDFRRIKERVVRVNVDCFNSTQTFLQRGSSVLLKLLPKKRKNEDYEDDNDDEPVNINWEQTSVNEHPMHGGYAIEHRRSLPDSPPINYSNSSPNSQSDHGHSHESVHVSEGFEPISVSFPDFPIHQQDEHYMVLYSGNAEVVGNFRALNFYKASDINIKEDVRLLSNDNDCRDTLMRINGVDYKFKPGIHPNVNKRFVGYIAQQVESVVPEAVQLINGILHVDYESLIPFLSESIRQNFNDIKNIKADNEKIYQAIDSMYDAFIDKSPSAVTPLIDKKKKKHGASTSLAMKLLIVSLAVAFTIAGAFGLLYWQHARVGGQSNPEAIPVSPLSPEKLPIQPLKPTLSISPDRYALQALYFATNGPEWENQDHWLTESSICTWYGITCSQFGEQVIVLVLTSNRLNGTIPESIGLLSQLRGLNMAYNNLHGTIPSSIYNITTLVHITLMFNNLVGTISPNVSNWSILNSLELSGNKLSGTIPRTIGEMTNLGKLGLINNKLEGTIPPFLPGELFSLDLTDNNLVGTVPDLRVLDNLYHVNLERNQLAGTLPSLPRGLRSINLSHNRFNGTLEALESLNRTSTEPLRIDVSHNQLSGDISPLMQYPFLTSLDVSFNSFTLFSTMLNITDSEWQCNASENSFKCPLPSGADVICQATCS
jgi:hypothetical protein